MVQFKDVFLGRDPRDYTRAASSQRCVRAGGKHNDLENVGYTARHHTFFEMLGNFSFGDYFKREAIEFAWEFLTSELKIPKDKLWVTVFRDDDEAADLWLKHIGVDPSRVSRRDEKDNFWSMGDTGPCGPCTEIFYDHGPGVPGGPPGTPDEDGDRYVEIWNLVFMQFDRAADGTLTPLPKPSVDTGMGLERIAAVMQGVHSNYDIDLFRNLIAAAGEGHRREGPRAPASLRVIADHIRAATFLIADGVLPGNEGRGYVLRRIIRRALRHGYELGVDEPFFHKLVKPLEREMGAAFPELTAGRGPRRAGAAHGGRALRRDALPGHAHPRRTRSPASPASSSPATSSSSSTTPTASRWTSPPTSPAPAASAWTARASRRRWTASASAPAPPASSTHGRRQQRAASTQKTAFTGYDSSPTPGRVIAAHRRRRARSSSCKAGEAGALVLDRTPFYAESGGQVGDRGVIHAARHCASASRTRRRTATPTCTSAPANPGTVTVGADGHRRGRRRRARRHRAQPLRHAPAARRAAPRARHPRHAEGLARRAGPAALRLLPLRGASSPSSSREIERLVNDEIRANAEGETRVMKYDEAVGAAAPWRSSARSTATEVRVLRFGDFSTELCGGTHVRRTGDIGLFKIIAESGIAAGIRRIEAVTGELALDRIAEEQGVLARLADLVKGSRADLEPQGAPGCWSATAPWRRKCSSSSRSSPAAPAGATSPARPPRWPA